MPECQTLVHAGVLVTQDAERRILAPGALAISGGVIHDVGPAGELAARWQPVERLDLGNMLVLPGLVNAHS
ncbi:MAG: S-adenosylhomocysteine deaminase, partial [Desulfovibrio sp.]|nr:S-adenosylhomocysteine deaminase [Desulfovibrio sp.]